MRDYDIRKMILSDLTEKFLNDPGTLVIEELGLCEGEARVDIAVVNGSIHGFEIKSDQDTLKRLAGQAAVYGRVLDAVTLVVSHAHFDHALEIIPPWWGVILVKKNSRQTYLKRARKDGLNPGLDPFAVAQFLWRDEAFEVLRSRNLHRGLAKKPRAILWKTIAECMPINELTALVRRLLKSRQNWRSGWQQE